MPPDLKVRVKEAASENNRSMNAEILSRLEASFATNDAVRPDLKSPEAHAIIESIFQYLAETGWSPPSDDVTDKKTQRILNARKAKKHESP